MSVSRIGNQQHLSPIEGLPNEQLISILALLPPSNVQSCCTLSHRFNVVASDSVLWKNLVGYYCSSYVINLFDPIVNKGLMTWKEVWRFRAIADLMLKFHKPANSDDAVSPLENIWPYPEVIRYGIQFRAKSPNIEAIGQKSYEGKSGTILKALTHDETYIYAYRADGVLIQWNPRTGESQEIETPYSQNDLSIQKYRAQIEKEEFPRLSAQDGFVVIIHECSLLEIIDVERNKGITIDQSLNKGRFRCRAKVRDKKIYSIYADRIYIYNLRCETKENRELSKMIGPLNFYYEDPIDLSKMISREDCKIDHISFCDNRIIAQTTENVFIIANERKSGFIRQYPLISEKHPKYDTMLGFLLLGLHCNKDMHVSITDFRTQEIKEVCVAKNRELISDGFEEIVMICKTSRPFEIINHNLTQDLLEGIQRTTTAVCNWFNDLIYEKKVNSHN